MVFQLGAIPSPQDDRDYCLNEFTNIEVAFSDNFLVSPYKSEFDIKIYNQNPYPMCVGFAISSIARIYQYNDIEKQIDMSPGWIYGNRLPEHCQSEGMYPREALSMLIKEGIPSWQDFPVVGYYYYCAEEVKKQKEKLLPKAMENRALSYIRLNNNDEIRTALMKTGAVLLCIRVTKDFDDCPTSGILDKPYGNSRGNHAIYIVGWKTINNRLYWICCNSWGERFGNSGVCYIQFDYSGIVETWGITDLPKQAPKTEISLKIGESFYLLNGIKKTLDVPAKIINGRTFVPLRFIAESLGVNISWDNINKQVKVNNGIIALGENVILENGRILIGLRYIGEILSCAVGWNNETKIVTIIK